MWRASDKHYAYHVKHLCVKNSSSQEFKQSSWWLSRSRQSRRNIVETRQKRLTISIWDHRNNDFFSRLLWLSPNSFQSSESSRSPDSLKASLHCSVCEWISSLCHSMIQNSLQQILYGCTSIEFTTHTSRKINKHTKFVGPWEVWLMYLRVLF